MNYPKKIMRWNELLKMGMPKEILKRAYDSKDLIGWKINPSAKNSPIVFDTEALDKFIAQQKKLEQEIKRQTMMQRVC